MRAGVWLTALLLPGLAAGHDGGLALLDLKAQGEGNYAFHFATKGKGAAKLSPRFPTRCKVKLLPVYPLQGSMACGQSLKGERIEFFRRPGAHPLVLARLHEEGETLEASAQLPAPLLLPAAKTEGGGFGASLALGFDHLLGGWDHLAFLALLLLAWRRGERGGPWRLLGLVTAFTLGHAASLSLAGLGLLSLPSAPVEALIAFSVLLMARECLLDRPKISYPLLLSMGLVHGLGFAGQLESLGLDQGQLLQKLLGFNLGLELAQLLALGLAGALFYALNRFMAWIAPLVSRSLAYGLGGLAAAWTLERSGAILGL